MNENAWPKWRKGVVVVVGGGQVCLCVACGVQPAFVIKGVQKDDGLLKAMIV